MKSPFKGDLEGRALGFMELLVEDIGVDGFVLRLLCEGDLVGEGLVGVHEAGAGGFGYIPKRLATLNLVLRDGRGALGVHEGEVGALTFVLAEPL